MQKYLPNVQWGLIFSSGFYTKNDKVQHETFCASLVSNEKYFSTTNFITAKTRKSDGTVVDLVNISSFDNIPSDISNISKIIRIPYCPCNLYPYDIENNDYFFQNENGSTKEGTERGFAYQFHLGDKFTTLSTAHTESEEGTTPSHTLRLPMFKADNLFNEINFGHLIKVTLSGDISKNQKRFNHMDDSKVYTSEFFDIGFFFENNSVYYPLEDFKLAPVDNVVPIPKIKIEYYVSNAMTKISGDNRWEWNFIQECVDEYKKEHPEYQKRTYIGLKEILSEYGTTSESECFAEAFAEFYGGENPREFAKIFGKKLDALLKGVK